MKATYTIEQADNGITIRADYHDVNADKEFRVVETPREEAQLGKLLWEDIKHVMDMKTANTVEVELEFKTNEDL